MTKLTPVKRVDKNGVLTTKHVRANEKQPGGFLARIMPALDGSAREQRNADLTVLTEEIKKEIAPRDESALVKILGRYSSRTITAIKDAYCGTGQMAVFIEDTYTVNERDIRTAAHFKELLDSYKLRSPDIFRSVRDSLGTKDIDCIPAGSQEYVIAHAVLEVALEVATTRDQSRNSQVEVLQAQGVLYIDATNRVLKDMSRDGSAAYMTPELALLISGKPERVSDIVRYLSDKKASPRDVDMELLTMYLNSDTPAIADGLL